MNFKQQENRLQSMASIFHYLSLISSFVSFYRSLRADFKYIFTFLYQSFYNEKNAFKSNNGYFNILFKFKLISMRD